MTRKAGLKRPVRPARPDWPEGQNAGRPAQPVVRSKPTCEWDETYMKHAYRRKKKYDKQAQLLQFLKLSVSIRPERHPNESKWRSRIWSMLDVE